MSAHTPSDRSMLSGSSFGDTNASALEQALHDRGTVFVIGSCIVIVTGVLLGMTWLRDLWLGVPIGLWLILGGYILSMLGQPRDARLAMKQSGRWRAPNAITNQLATANDGSILMDRQHNERAHTDKNNTPTDDASHDERADGTPWSGAMGEWQGPMIDAEMPLTPVGRLLLRAGDAISAVVGLVNTSATDAGFAVQLMERCGWPDRPLRVGMCVRKDLSSWILSSEGVCDIQWVRVTSSVSPKLACHKHVLDAIVIEDELGHVSVICPEVDGKDAGWNDWSNPLPLSYASAFALRFDTADTVLGRSSELRAADGPMVRAMIELAAATSRNEARLDSCARWRGRRPIDANNSRITSRTIEACWANIGRTFASLASTNRQTELQRTASRILSAYLATTDGMVDLNARRDGIERAHDMLFDEPNIGLRVIAARIASFDDEEAFELASEMLDDIRRAGVEPMTDPWAYLVSELNCVVPSHLALGRLAAGIVLVFAHARVSKLTYLREDLTEDLEQTSWLVDRDADVAMLVRLMRQLEAIRSADGSADEPESEGNADQSDTAAQTNRCGKAA